MFLNFNLVFNYFHLYSTKFTVIIGGSNGYGRGGARGGGGGGAVVGARPWKVSRTGGGSW